MSSPALFSGCPFSLSEGFPPQPCGAYSNTRNVPTLRLPSFVPRGILPIRGPQAPLCLVVAGGVCQGEGESKHPPLDCIFGDFLGIQKVTPRRAPPQQARCGPCGPQAAYPYAFAVCDGSALLDHARIGRMAGSPSLCLGLVSRAQAPFPSPSLRSRLPCAPILALLCCHASPRPRKVRSVSGRPVQPALAPLPCSSFPHTTR